MNDQDIWNLSIVAVASAGGACVALLVQMLIRWRKAQVRKTRAIRAFVKQRPNRSIDFHTPMSMWESVEPVRAEPAAEEPAAKEPSEEVHVPMCPPPSVWERLLDDDDA